MFFLFYFANCLTYRSSETLFEVVALYDFCGDLKRDELEFKEGSRIRVSCCTDI